MTNINNNSNPSLKAFLFAVLAVFVAPFVSALPSTASTNLQTSSGVSTQVSGPTLTVTAPDKAILNWNAFGSGSDNIGFADTVAYKLPTSSSSVLNVVSGGAATTIDGTLTSNGKVYILNPNGIVIGPGGRIEVPSLILSSVDNVFAAQFEFINSGKLPSESGIRSASGNITINGTAILTIDNALFISKDIAINGGLVNGNLTVNADGAATIGSAASPFYAAGNFTVNNASGNTTLGAPTAMVGSNATITVNGTTGNIVNAAGSSVTARSIAVATGGDVNVSGLNALTLAFTAKNATVTLPARDNISVAANVTGNLSVTGTNAFTIDGLKNSAGNTTIASNGKLTIGAVHVDSNGNTQFTGSSVVDSKNDVFVYGPTAFTATAGDVAITKTGHSFGPLSITATANASVYESAAINLNNARAVELALKTNQFFFQTPLTSTLAATKLSLTTGGNVVLAAGTIANGLTIVSDGDVDLGRLSLATNLNNIAPTVTAKGTVTSPAP